MGIAAAFFFWWLLTPSYIELTIPVTAHPIGYFWWETQHSTLRYADEIGTLNLFRHVGTGYADHQGWATQEEAMQYFHGWLSEHGWEERSIYTDGDPIAPETRFLRHQEEFRIYSRPGDTWGDSSRVVLAIEPIPEVDGYEVSIVTAKASLLRRLSDAFDD